MREFLKENRNLIIAGSISVILVSASGYYTYKAYSRDQEAFTELQTVSASLTKIQNSNPTPSTENLTELQQQKKDAAEAVEKLTSEVKALDIPLPVITPTDFQKSLNTKAAELAKLAEANNVQIPANFYLNFDRYQKTVPKTEVTPFLARQLQVAGLISETLFQTGPIELKSFERQEFDPERDQSVVAKEKEAAAGKDKKEEKDKDKPKHKDKEKDKDKNSDSSKPLLSGQFFKLQFTTRPPSLREFLNKITSQNSCLLVVRSIKIENEKQKGPSKKGPENEVPGATAQTATPGAPVNLNALAATPTEASPAAGGSGADIGQYILGDEKIDVTLRLELVSFNEEPPKTK